MGFLKYTLVLEIRRRVMIWAITIFFCSFAVNPLEAGSDPQLRFAVNTFAVEGDQEILKDEDDQNEHAKKRDNRDPILNGKLVIRVPSAIPSGIPPVSDPEKEAIPVTFRTLVSGPAMRPGVLLIDEVSRDGKVIKPAIAELRDNGKGADSLSGDGFYAGVAAIASATETEKYYRARDRDDDTLTSGIVTFPITKLPLQVRASDPKTLVDYEWSSEKLYANEVILAARVGVSPRRIREIVAKVGHNLEETLIIVVFLPPLDIYLVEIEGSKTVEGVRRAIKAFSAQSGVRRAVPNFLGQDTAAGSPNDMLFPPPCTGGVSDCQHYMKTIRADQAWDLLETRAGGTPMIGSPNVKVAVIDNVIERDHPDLDGQVEDNTTSTAQHHGTMVAGLIAAKHNTDEQSSATPGIAGVAPNTRIMPYIRGNTIFTALAFRNAVDAGAKIINLSRQYNSVAGDNLPDAVCYAICRDVLIVAAAGNRRPCTSDLVGAFPAQYNNGNLICDNNIDSACPNVSNGEIPINANEGILAVGAIDIDRNDDETVDTDTIGVIAEYSGGDCSNVQPWIDIYAPGAQIKTTDSGDTWATVDGTSFAAPLVAGAAAVVWGANENLSNTEVEEILRTRGQALDLEPSHQVHPLLAGKSATEINTLVGGERPVLDLLSALNQAPTAISLDNSSVDENQPPGTAVGTFSTTDPDAGDSHLYSLVPGIGDTDNASFAIAGATLQTNAVFDFESKSSYSLRVQTDDQNGGTLEQQFTVTVSNVNEAPVLAAVETDALSYNEDDAPTPVTGSLTVSDVDDTIIKSATVQITNNYQNGQDVMGFTNTGNISGNWTAGTLTLDGPDTLANFEAALRTVTYQNTSQNPSALPRTISYTVTDIGDSASNTVIRTINVTPVDDPYDIVFVLDRSGSMALTTHIDPPASDRWDALKRAVALFSAVIEDGDSTCAGSRFGLTLFASRVLSFSDPDPDFKLHDNDFDALFGIGSGLQDKVTDELGLQTPFGSTAMGSGLQKGIDKFDDDTPRARVIVLFSDGEQNQPPFVNSSGTGYEGDGAVDPGGTGLFKIVTVGIGHPSGNYLSTLQGLASNPDGTHSYYSTRTGETTSDGTAIADALLSAVQTALDSCSPQMVVSHSGTLSNTVTPPAFDVNREVNHLLLLISFGRDFKASEFAAVLAGIHIEKDGTDITDYFQPVSMGAVTNSVLLKADFMAPHPRFGTIKPEGSYTLKIKKPASIDGDLGYRVVTYADDHKLDIDWNVSPSAPRVNQPFTPTLHLLWDGQPLAKASVEVLVLKPGDDLGDVLARHPIKVDPKDVDIFGSPGVQKYNHLLEKDPAFVKRLLPDEQRFTLAHQEDGNYRATYNPGDVSGIYQVFYRVRADLPTTGEIQRVVMQSVYVRFGNIDLDRSTVSSAAQGTTVTINMRPMTTYGRFIGPAQGSAFSVDGNDIKLGGITDHQDGSYTLVLTGNPDAQVTIKLLGENIYQGPASKFGVKGGTYEKKDGVN